MSPLKFISCLLNSKKLKNGGVQGVTVDMEAWWPKLKAGGIFAGHDYVTQDDFEMERCSHVFSFLAYTSSCFII
jgi:hypothetical protein